MSQGYQSGAAVALSGLHRPCSCFDCTVAKPVNLVFEVALIIVILPDCPQVEVRASSRRKQAATGADSAIGKIAAAHAQREERAKKKKQEEEEKQEQQRRERQQQQEEEEEAEEEEDEVIVCCDSPAYFV